eukprot:scaffold4275_cov143-Skeletonema_marinoi.AAC.4
MVMSCARLLFLAVFIKELHEYDDLHCHLYYLIIFIVFWQSHGRVVDCVERRLSVAGATQRYSEQSKAGSSPPISIRIECIFTGESLVQYLVDCHVSQLSIELYLGRSTHNRWFSNTWYIWYTQYFPPRLYALLSMISPTFQELHQYGDMFFARSAL